MNPTVYDHYFLQMTAVVAKIFLIFVPPSGLEYSKSTFTFSFQIFFYFLFAVIFSSNSMLLWLGGKKCLTHTSSLTHVT